MSVGRLMPSSERSLFSSSESTRVAAFRSELEVGGDGGVAAADSLRESGFLKTSVKSTNSVQKNQKNLPTSILTSDDTGDLLPVTSASR